MKETTTNGMNETTINGIIYTTNGTNSTFNDLVEKYLMCDKRTLAELLALRDLQDKNSNPYPQYPQYPQYPPYVPQYPLSPIYCQVCTNPFHDCVNCPYHYTSGIPNQATATNVQYVTDTTADVKIDAEINNKGDN
jgi:hypothetical protein